MHAQVKRLESALVPHLVPDADVQRLLRIPGVGKACAFSIRLEVDDISRFETERQFFSYGRVVPGADRRPRPSQAVSRRQPLPQTRLATHHRWVGHAGVRAIQYYRRPAIGGREVKAWYTSKRLKKPEAVARALVAKEIARIDGGCPIRKPRAEEARRLQRPVLRASPRAGGSL